MPLPENGSSGPWVVKKVARGDAEDPLDITRGCRMKPPRELRVNGCHVLAGDAFGDEQLVGNVSPSFAARSARQDLALPRRQSGQASAALEHLR